MKKTEGWKKKYSDAFRRCINAIRSRASDNGGVLMQIRVGNARRVVLSTRGRNADGAFVPEDDDPFYSFVSDKIGRVRNPYQVRLRRDYPAAGSIDVIKRTEIRFPRRFRTFRRGRRLLCGADRLQYGARRRGFDFV